MTLNERAAGVVDEIERNADRMRVAVAHDGTTRVIDCGVGVTGSLAAGLALARACLADLGAVTLVPGMIDRVGGLAVQVVTDDPVRACLASQYAGWQVKVGKYFAMGSGPMRAVAGTEPLFDNIPGKEVAPCAVGILESRQLPTVEVVADIRSKVGAAGDSLSLLVAPAASLAGTIQVVARSIETALHKLHELKFDVNRIVSGYGVVPLPPVAADEVGAIGRTNDAILYGGRVTLWVRADDDELAEVGPRVPSNSSADHGVLFAELFARYGNFYQIDPLLFSPAEIEFRNLATGRCHRFGKIEPGLVRKSFDS